MKESDITPEVIAKAKEIASLWRMEIYKGCWYLYEGDFPLLFYPGHDGDIEKVNTYVSHLNKKRHIPIPSISDCLEKLREYYDEVGIEHINDKWETSVYLRNDGKDSPVIDGEGESPLLASLKCLLSVLLEVLGNA